MQWRFDGLIGLVRLIGFIGLIDLVWVLSGGKKAGSGSRVERSEKLFDLDTGADLMQGVGIGVGIGENSRLRMGAAYFFGSLMPSRSSIFFSMVLMRGWFSKKAY
jgi:hypothetical protein